MLFDKTIPTGTNHLPVAVAWNASLSTIEKELKNQGYFPKLAHTLLAVCSYLIPEHIPRNLLLSWLKTNYPKLETPEIILDKVFGLLRAYSLIHMDNEGTYLSVHRLVQEVAKIYQPNALNYNLFFLSFKKLQDKENYKLETDFRDIVSIKRGYSILPHFEKFLNSDEIKRLLKTNQGMSVEIAETIIYFSAIYREIDFNFEKSIEWLTIVNDYVNSTIATNSNYSKINKQNNNLYCLSAYVKYNIAIILGEFEFRMPTTYKKLINDEKFSSTYITFKNALQDGLKGGCTKINSAIRHNFAQAQALRGDLKEAKHQVIESLKTTDTQDTIYIRNLCLIGYILSELKEYAEAEQYLHLAETLLTDMNLTHTLEMATMYYFFGYYYNRIGKYDLAIKYLIKSKKLREEISNTYLRLIKTNIELGVAYEKLGKFQEAINAYETSLKVANVKLEDSHKDIVKLKEKINLLQSLKNNTIKNSPITSN